MAEGKEIAVRVALRARPLVTKEIKEGAQECLKFMPNEPQVIVGLDKAFTFDYTFPGNCKQEALYETSVSDRVDFLFKGYNVTVLAYGQTGSGKTYTMGTSYCSEEGEAGCGVIQRAVNDIFKGIHDRSAVAEFVIKVSFLEVYNEDVFDLLQRSKDNKDIPAPLSIREDQDGIRIAGLTELPVVSPQETFHALELGTRSRTTASTNMNTRSSRSHAIFTISLEQRALDNSSDVTIAKFHLVDLAGSERAHKTGALGDRFKEGVNINRGLLALGNVISALCDNNSHIPYRDSKLTRLLQDSLGGNSHTIMIACVSPADSNFDETINTLRYADRARKIKNKPIINRDPQNAELIQLRKQVQQLQSQLLQGGQTTSIIKKEVGDEDKQKYNADLILLLKRNKNLETENQRLVNELQLSVDQTTALCEKAMMAELTNEELIQELQKISEETSTIIEALMELSVDNFDLLNRLQELKDCQGRMVELTCKKVKKEAEFSMYSPTKKLQQVAPTGQELDKSPYSYDPLFPPEYEDGSDENKLDVALTLKQAEMTRALADLERNLAEKEEMATKLQQSSSEYVVMHVDTLTNVILLEEQIATLQKEKEQLINELKSAQSNNNIGKISEMRRKQVQECEAKIAEFKKKIKDHEKLQKYKQDSERQVKNLRQEIQEIKANRVKLIRQIKSEAEKFRTLKKEKEQEVESLKRKDRKRQFQMTKLQTDFAKQNAVLKRKMEEATAANKRLTAALQQQKKVADRRDKEKQQAVMGIGTRVQQWLSQDIEVVFRSKETKIHLENLLEDRKTITQQLEDLELMNKSDEPPSKKKFESSSTSDEDSPSEDAKSLQKQFLKQQLQERNEQIANLQQKLTGLEQDESNKHRWDTVQSMVEAKCAMKFLFENVISAKMDCVIQETQYNEKIYALETKTQQLQDQYDEIVSDKDNVEEKMREMKNNYEFKISRLIREYEDKTIYLLKQINSLRTSDSMNQNDSLMERIKFQESEIARLSYISEEIEKKNAEIEKKDAEIADLKSRLDSSRKKGGKAKLLEKVRYTDEDLVKPSPTVVNRKKEMSTSIMQNFLEGNLSESDYSDSNDENDPDFRGTPMYKRTKTMRKNNSDPSDYESQKIKDNLISCKCKVSCGWKRCGCNKQGRLCSTICKCKVESCCNRDSMIQSSSVGNDCESGKVSDATFIQENSSLDLFYSPNRQNNTTIVLSENTEPNDEVFVCPIFPLTSKKRAPEEAISVNDSGLLKQAFRPQRSQRYFPPLKK